MHPLSQSYEFDFEAVFEADDYMHFYQESLADERSQAEVQGLVNLIELNRPMRILDLACGFGRHANRLAALGHQVTGIDLNEDFLDIARKEAASKELRVDYVQGDMRQLNYEAEFDRILLLFTAFGYFNDEENYLVVKNIYRALKSEGMIIFDVPNRDVQLKFMHPAYITEVGNDLMIDRISYDTLTGRLHNRRLVIRNGVRKDKPFSIRYYNANEIYGLLKQAGFERIKFYSTWERLPVEADSRRLIIVAEK